MSIQRETDGKKLTPHEAAKEIIWSYASQSLDFWPVVDSDKLTKRETRLVGEAIEKHLKRVRKLLGFKR